MHIYHVSLEGKILCPSMPHFHKRNLQLASLTFLSHDLAKDLIPGLTALPSGQFHDFVPVEFNENADRKTCSSSHKYLSMPLPQNLT